MNKIVKELNDFLEFAAPLLIGVIIAWLILQYVIVNAIIPSSSMMNQICTGDRVIGNRLTYKLSNPKRFDIAIFNYPVDESKLYIKRIIGLPGETVDIVDGLIYVNESSEPLDEWYLPEEWINSNTGYHFEIPEGCYLMLGDNRNYSADARFWAEEASDYGLDNSEEYTYVQKNKILAKAVFTYYPRIKLLR